MNFLSLFRKVAIAEGISYLLLVVASILKRTPLQWHKPVLILGSIHGGLFVLFCILLLVVWIKYHWKFIEVLLAFLLSFLPFGTFYMDYRLKKKGSIL